MSNIANQLVAVTATLLGFVAHDVLTERQATEAAAARVEIAQAIDPVITRSIDLDRMTPGRVLDISMHNVRETVPAPGARRLRRHGARARGYSLNGSRTCGHPHSCGAFDSTCPAHGP